MATQIKTIISNFLKDKKKDILLKNNIKKIIYEILNPKMRDHVSLGAIYKNKLILYVDSSIVGYKTRLLKNKILKETIIQKHKIKDILIKVKDGKKQ